MAEPFKQTPASRVFGFGLRPQQPAPTFFGTPILADRNRLSPYLRQNAFEEQQMAAQEDALAAQQQQMAMQQQLAMRNQQIMDAEMAAEQDLAAGEQLGNIFKKNPALAFSRNAGQFASAAQIMQPSNAMKAAIPSLAMKLPIEERTIFNQLLSDPEFSTNPFAAYDEAQRRSARARQHSELRKAGVPLSKIDTTRDYSPIEYEDLIQQHKQKSANPRLDYLKDFMDNVGKRVAAFEESDGAFDEKGNPTKALVDLRNKYAQISDLYDQEMMGLVMPKQAASDAATAQKITSPAAEGGAPKSVVPGMPGFVGDKPVVTPVDGGGGDVDVDVSDEIASADLTIPGSAAFLANEAREGRLPLAAHKSILKKLEDAVKNPPSMKHLNRAQADANKADILSAYKTVKDRLGLVESQEKVINPAWTRAKKSMESKVVEFAKKNGYDPETLWRTIAEESVVGASVNADPMTMGGGSPGLLTAEEILGDDFAKENADLFKVQAKREAVRNAEAPIGARLGRLLGAEGISNYDVLKEAAKEKVAAMSGGGSVAKQAPMKTGETVKVGGATITKRK